MLPSNYDATGGRDKWGTPNASIPQYLENNRQMNTMVPVSAPTPARTSQWQAPGIGGAMAIAGNPAYSRLDRPSTEADAFAPTATELTAAQYTENDMRGNYPRTAAAPRPAMPLGRPSTEADAFADPRAPSVTPDAWQRSELKPALARLSAQPKAAERWGGFSGELRRPMGQGALDRTEQQKMDSAESAARQSYDYYARKDEKRFRAGGQGGSRRSNFAF